MIYDYEDQEGYVSLWVGVCRDYDAVDRYLSTIYMDDDYEEGSEPDEIWKELLLPANQSRACEQELIDAFNYETFNQFEYDFGLSFDEDFREAAVRDEVTDDPGILFEGFSCQETFIEEARSLMNGRIPKCNTAVVLYDFKYSGGITEAEHRDVHLYFVGYAKYQE